MASAGKQSSTAAAAKREQASAGRKLAQAAKSASPSQQDRCLDAEHDKAEHQRGSPAITEAKSAKDPGMAAASDSTTAATVHHRSQAGLQPNVPSPLQHTASTASATPADSSTAKPEPTSKSSTPSSGSTTAQEEPTPKRAKPTVPQPDAAPKQRSLYKKQHARPRGSTSSASGSPVASSSRAGSKTAESGSKAPPPPAAKAAKTAAAAASQAQEAYAHATRQSNLEAAQEACRRAEAALKMGNTDQAVSSDSPWLPGIAYRARLECVWRTEYACHLAAELRIGGRWLHIVISSAD